MKTENEIQNTSTIKYQKHLTQTEYDLILNYLYLLYIKKIKDEDFKVDEIYTVKENDSFFIDKVKFTFINKDLYTAYLDQRVAVFITFQKQQFILNAFVATYSEPSSGIIKETIREYPTITLKNYNKDSLNLTKDLLSELYKKAILNSFLNKEAVIIDDEFVDSLRILPQRLINVNEIIPKKIFLPEEKIYQIERFKKAILTDGEPLKFLLSGVPGTGKTQIINSIIKSVYGKVLIGKIEGFYMSFSKVFRFAEIFPKSLLIMDDIDLFLKNRDQNYEVEKLFEFLQYIDSSYDNKIFILATTNDKNLVDIAATRPGRFDLVIDMDNINKENYLDLIKRETKQKEIIELFDNDFISLLKEKNVTGAFIVNFIKQLRSELQLNKKINRQIAYEFFDMLYNGFYKNNLQKQTNGFGFQ